MEAIRSSWVGETLAGAGSWSRRATAPWLPGLLNGLWILTPVQTGTLISAGPSQRGWVDNAADYPMPAPVAS